MVVGRRKEDYTKKLCNRLEKKKKKNQLCVYIYIYI